MTVIFNQYLRPSGRVVDNGIDLDPKTETQAKQIQLAGFELSAEVIWENVSFSVDNGDVTLANAVVNNGPGAKEAVTKMIQDAYDALIKMQKDALDQQKEI